jgi:hypothetical protein
MVTLFKGLSTKDNLAQLSPWSFDVYPFGLPKTTLQKVEPSTHEI